jgi:hypothetical protein
LRGEPIGKAIGIGGEEADDGDRFAADLGTWFRDWTAEGFFLAVSL